MGRDLLNLSAGSPSVSKAGRNLLELEQTTPTEIISDDAPKLIPKFRDSSQIQLQESYVERGHRALFPDSEPADPQVLTGPLEAGGEFGKSLVKLPVAGVAAIGNLLAGGSEEETSALIQQLTAPGTTNPYAMQHLENVGHVFENTVGQAGEFVGTGVQKALHEIGAPPEIQAIAGSLQHAGTELVLLGALFKGPKIAKSVTNTAWESLPIRTLRSKFVKERGLSVPSVAEFDAAVRANPEMSLGEFLRQNPQYKEAAFEVRKAPEQPAERPAAGSPKAEPATEIPKSQTQSKAVKIPEADLAKITEIEEKYFGIENAPDDVLETINPESLKTFLEARHAEAKETAKQNKKQTAKPGRKGWRANKKYKDILQDQRDILEVTVGNVESYAQAVEMFSNPDGNLAHRYALHVARERFGISEQKGTAKKEVSEKATEAVKEKETTTVAATEEGALAENADSGAKETGTTVEPIETEESEIADQQVQDELVAEEKAAEPAPKPTAIPIVGRESFSEVLRVEGIPEEQINASLEIWKAFADTRGMELDEFIRSAVKSVQGEKAGTLVEATTPTLEQGNWDHLFYSQMARFIDSKFPNSQPAGQALKNLEKSVGQRFKPEEWEWSGVPEYLAGMAEQGATVTRDNLLQVIREQGFKIDVKTAWENPSHEQNPLMAEYQQAELSMNSAQNNFARELYTGAGKANATLGLHPDHITANLKEQYLQATPEARVKIREHFDRTTKKYFSRMEDYSNFFNLMDDYINIQSQIIIDNNAKSATWAGMVLPGRNKDYREIFITDPSGAVKYLSNHFSDLQNLIVHTRADVRELVDGTEALYANEIQSDWHQEGRRKGYQQDADVLWDAYNTRQYEYMERIAEAGGPRITDLSFDKALEIVRTFYAGRLEISERSPELLNGKVSVKDHFKEYINSYGYMTGQLGEASNAVFKHLSEKEIFDTAELYKDAKGQEFAVVDVPFKNKAWTELAVKNLIITALQEGHNQIAFPASPEAIATIEQWGNTPILNGEQWFIPSGTNSHDVTPIVNRYLIDIPRFLKKLSKKYPMVLEETSLKDLSAYDEYFPKEVFNTVVAKIPPETAQMILDGGLPLFQKNKGNPLGSVEFIEQNKAILRLFDKANISTIMHESGHIFRRYLTAEEQVVANEYVEAETSTWNVDQEEKFARAWEAYLRRGKAPVEALKAIFAKMREWLKKIYRTIKGSEIDVTLTKDITTLFDTILTPKELRPKPKMPKGVKAPENNFVEEYSMLDSIEEARVPGEVRDAIATATNKVRNVATLAENKKVREARKLMDDEDPFGLLAIESEHPRVVEILEILADMEGAIAKKLGVTISKPKPEPKVVEPEPVVEEPKTKVAEYKDLDAAELDYDLNPRKFGDPAVAQRFLPKRPEYDTVVKAGDKYFIGKAHPDTELRGDWNIEAIDQAQENLDEPFVEKFNEDDKPKTEIIKVSEGFEKVSTGVYLSNLSDGRMVAIMKESPKNWEVYLGTPEQVQTNTGELIGAYPNLAKARKALGDGKQKQVHEVISYKQLVDYLDKQVKKHKEETAISRENELEALIAEQEADMIENSDGSHMSLDEYREQEEGDGHSYFEERDLGDVYDDLTKVIKDDQGMFLPKDEAVNEARKRLVKDVKELGKIIRGRLQFDKTLHEQLGEVERTNMRLERVRDFLKSETGSINLDGSPILNLMKGLIRDLTNLFRNVKAKWQAYKDKKIQQKQFKKKQLSKKESVRIGRYAQNELRDMVTALRSSSDDAIQSMITMMEETGRMVPEHVRGDKKLPKPQRPMISEKVPEILEGAEDLIKTWRGNFESPNHLFGRIFSLDDNPVIDAFEASMANATNRRNFINWKRTILKGVPSAESVVHEELIPIYERLRPLMEARRRQGNLINNLNERYRNTPEGEDKKSALTKLNLAKKKAKKQSKKISEQLAVLLNPALEKLAKGHADVRIILNAAGELPEGISMSAQELAASEAIRKYFDFTGQRLAEVGIPIIRTRTYMHRIIPEAFKGEGQQAFADTMKVPAILNFLHQNAKGKIWFPSAHMILNRYIPLVERKINYQMFLNRWADFIAQAPPELHDYMKRWIDSNLNRKLNTAPEKILNSVVAFEYFRLIAFSTSVAFKHLTKVADTFSIYDAVTNVKATNKAIQVMWRNVASKAGMNVKDTNDMKLMRAYINSRALVRMMDESPGAKVLLEQSKLMMGGPTMAVEYFDNGVSILATAMAGHMKGFSPEYIQRAIWQTVLLANFRGSWDQPLPLKSSTGRAVSMFQNTPYKLYEYRADMIKKALENDTDAFGTPYGARLVKYIMLFGAAETVARLNDTSILDLALHFPYISHFIVPSDKDPGFEFHAPKPNASPIIQLVTDTNQHGAWEGMKKHFSYYGQFSKMWKMMHQDYPTDWYATPIEHMLGLPRLDAPRSGKKKDSRSKRSKRSNRNRR